MPTDVLVESLRERARSVLWWTLGLVLLIAVTIAFYPSIRDDPALSDYAKDLPESLRALFAGGELDLASPTGYLNSQIFALTAPLVLLIFSIGAGSWAVAGEEERGTLELVLAHPVRRREYVVQRFLALGVLVAVLGIALLAAVAVGSVLVNLDIAFGRLLAASVSVALLALVFGSRAGSWHDQARACSSDRDLSRRRRHRVASRWSRAGRRCPRRVAAAVPVLPGPRPEPTA